MNVFECEIDTQNPPNGQLTFLPLGGRVIRGRFDFNRDSQPLAKLHVAEFPKGIPGQRLGIDFDSGEAWVAEPLHLPEYKAERDRILKRGLGLPKERDTIPVQPADYATWVYWLNRAVEAGIARIVKGKLPEKVEGKIRKSFVTPEPKRDRRDVTNEKLTAILFAMLTPEQRKRAEAALAE
jgi:hypothetical protein